MKIVGTIVGMEFGRFSGGWESEFHLLRVQLDGSPTEQMKPYFSADGEVDLYETENRFVSSGFWTRSAVHVGAHGEFVALPRSRAYVLEMKLTLPDGTTAQTPKIKERRVSEKRKTNLPFSWMGY